MNKLQEIVVGLNQFEAKAFRSYLQSPYFTEDKMLLPAFDAARKEVEQTGELNKQVLFKKVHGKRYHDKTWRYQQSILCKHLEYFLTLRHLDSNKLLYNTILLQTLANKNFEKAWHFTHDVILRKGKKFNADYYLKQYMAAENSLNFLSTKQSRKKELDYESVLKNLDSFYLAKKLQLACEVINLKNILKTNVELLLIEDLKKLATNPPFNEVPVIQIYYHILLSLTETENEKHFLFLHKLVLKHSTLFSVSELAEMYVYLKNYCIKKINSGKTEYNQILFEIYKEIIANKKLMYHDWLSQFEFKNIVSISLRLNEKKWCKNFIERYITFLKSNERRNALAYNTAYYLFSTENFKDAIRKLSNVEFTDVAYQIDARVILLKCYYELEDVDAFFYHASAFRLFLLRNRYLSDFQKTFNRNLIKFLSALLRANGSKTKLQKLKAAVEKEKKVADINWLLEKIEMAL
jgi:hypothetical protein